MRVVGYVIENVTGSLILGAGEIVIQWESWLGFQGFIVIFMVLYCSCYGSVYIYDF